MGAGGLIGQPRRREVAGGLDLIISVVTQRNPGSSSSIVWCASLNSARAARSNNEVKALPFSSKRSWLVSLDCHSHTLPHRS